MPQNPPPLPDFTRWPSFPFEGELRVKKLADPVEVEPPRSGEDASDCVACNTPDDAYIWVSERWRVRGMDRPTGLPAVLILECRSHLDIGDLPNLLAAELGVMTVRLERAIRSLDGVARVHVNRWGDGSAHLHMWFLARPYGRLQLRGTFLSLWDDLLPVIPEEQWLENLAMVAAWLAEFGGRAIAEPAHIQWESPSTFSDEPASAPATTAADSWRPTDLTDFESGRSSSEVTHHGELTDTGAETRNLSSYAARFTTPATTATPTDGMVGDPSPEAIDADPAAPEPPTTGGEVEHPPRREAEPSVHGEADSGDASAMNNRDRGSSLAKSDGTRGAAGREDGDMPGPQAASSVSGANLAAPVLEARTAE